MSILQFLPRVLRRQVESAHHQLVVWKEVWASPLRPVSSSRHSPEELERLRLQHLTQQQTLSRSTHPMSKPGRPPSIQDHPTEPSPGSTRIPVYYRDDNQLLWLSEDETLLEAGLRADLDLMFSCQMGGCAACKVRILTGEVEMEEPNCLSEEERAEGYCLACVARPLTPVAIGADEG